MGERPFSLDVKRLCGNFGAQLMVGYLRIEQRQSIECLSDDWATEASFRGMLDPDEGVIYIRQDDTVEGKITTALHEFLHSEFSGVAEEEIEEGSVILFQALNSRQIAFFEFMIEQYGSNDGVDLSNVSPRRILGK